MLGPAYSTVPSAAPAFAPNRCSAPPFQAKFQSSRVSIVIEYYDECSYQ